MVWYDMEVMEIMQRMEQQQGKKRRTDQVLNSDLTYSKCPALLGGKVCTTISVLLLSEVYSLSGVGAGHGGQGGHRDIHHV